MTIGDPELEQSGAIPDQMAVRPERFAAHVSARNHFELGATLSNLVAKILTIASEVPSLRLAPLLLREISAGVERIFKKISHPI